MPFSLMISMACIVATPDLYDMFIQNQVFTFMLFDLLIASDTVDHVISLKTPDEYTLKLSEIKWYQIILIIKQHCQYRQNAQSLQ